MSLLWLKITYSNVTCGFTKIGISREYLENFQQNDNLNIKISKAIIEQNIF